MAVDKYIGMEEGDRDLAIGIDLAKSSKKVAKLKAKVTKKDK